MKLLEAIEMLECDNLEMMFAILECIEDRISDVEFQEPICGSDYQYNKWEEKLSELQSIYEELDNLYTDLSENIEIENVDNKLKSIKLSIKMYQILYGGLKRLKI